MRDDLSASRILRVPRQPPEPDLERWAAVPSFRKRYCVSDWGRVLRLADPGSLDPRLQWPLLLKPTFSGGYFWVFLRSGDGQRRQYRVDRLALSAFADRPLAVFDVGYRNGDRRDLRLENLERLNTITVLGPPGTRRQIISG